MVFQSPSLWYIQSLLRVWHAQVRAQVYLLLYGTSLSTAQTWTFSIGTNLILIILDSIQETDHPVPQALPILSDPYLQSFGILRPSNTQLTLLVNALHGIENL
jgi:hypothetical protein